MGGIQRFQPKSKLGALRDEKISTHRSSPKKFKKRPRSQHGPSSPFVSRRPPSFLSDGGTNEASGGNEMALFVTASAALAAKKKDDRDRGRRTGDENSPRRQRVKHRRAGRHHVVTATAQTIHQDGNPDKRRRLSPEATSLRHTNLQIASGSVVTRVDTASAAAGAICAPRSLSANKTVRETGKSSFSRTNPNSSGGDGHGNHVSSQGAAISHNIRLAGFKQVWQERKKDRHSLPTQVVDTVDLTTLSDDDDEVEIVSPPPKFAALKKENPKRDYPLTWAERQKLEEDNARIKEPVSKQNCKDATYHDESSERGSLSHTKQKNIRVKHQSPVTRDGTATLGDDVTQAKAEATMSPLHDPRNGGVEAQHGSRRNTDITIRRSPGDIEGAANIKHVLLVDPNNVQVTANWNETDDDIAYNEDFDPSKSPDTQTTTTSGVLTCVEIELAWLMEESRFCNKKREGDWSFVWTYSSPALRVLLRQGKNDVYKKGPHILRKSVREAFKTKAAEIELRMRRGYRRPEMAKVVAAHRVLMRTQPNVTASWDLKKPAPVASNLEPPSANAESTNKPAPSLHVTAPTSAAAPWPKPAHRNGPRASGKSQNKPKGKATKTRTPRTTSAYKHLNKQEEEIAWLVEESIMQNVCEGIDFDYVKTHASSELRSLIQRQSGSHRWLPRLIRQTNAAVMKEYSRKREEVKDRLYSGFRREETRAALPSGYVSQSQYNQEKAMQRLAASHP